MATSPIFVGTPKTWLAALSAANTNRDGTGTIITIVTAPAGGTRIDKVRAVAAGTTTAGVVRLFLHDGTNFRLLREIMVQAVTPSATVEVWSQDIDFPGGLFLPNGWSLRASTHNAENFNVAVLGGDV